MKKIDRSDWFKGVKKIVKALTCTVLIIVGFYNCIAYGGVYKPGIANKKDTSVSSFIQADIAAGKIIPRLHYPNSVQRFYNLNNGAAAWVKENTDPKQAWQAMMLLDCVLQYGLFRDDYHPKELLYEPLHDMLEIPGKIGNLQKAEFDIILTDALITLINNLHYGKLNPVYPAEKIDAGGMLPFYAETALKKAKEQKDFWNAIESVQPKSKIYHNMQDHLRQLKGVYQEDCYQVPEEEVRKIAINMERLRWAEIDEDVYIQVNIPSFTLKLYRPDTFYKFKVIVGAPSKPTPTFNSQISWVTTFPKWKISDGSFSPIAHPGKTVFRFTDKSNIVLYEGPDKKLFNKAERAIGNKNIRLENSEALMRLLLSYSNSNGKIRLFNKAIKQHLTKNISLEKPVPIKVTYITCEVHKGLVVNYKDIYHLDKDLEMALYTGTETLTLK